MKKKNKKVELIIQFDNQDALEHFAGWLCESGEQDYFQWMEYREAEDNGNITAVEFHYHGEVDKTKKKHEPGYYGTQNFVEDNIIRTTCGRLTDDFDDGE